MGWRMTIPVSRAYYSRSRFGPSLLPGFPGYPRYYALG